MNMAAFRLCRKLQEQQEVNNFQSCVKSVNEHVIRRNQLTKNNTECDKPHVLVFDKHRDDIFTEKGREKVFWDSW